MRAELDETRAELKAKCEEVRGQVSELQREADHRSREMEELAWAHSAELQEISTEHVHKVGRRVYVYMLDAWCKYRVGDSRRLTVIYTCRLNCQLHVYSILHV